MLNRLTLIKLSKYATIGVLSNVFLYFVFLMLLHYGLSPIIASVLCYVCGLVNSYIFNKKWTFNSTRKHINDITSFMLAYGLGLIVTVISMHSLVLWVSPEFAQIIVIVISAVVIYVALNIFKFGRCD